MYEKAPGSTRSRNDFPFPPRWSLQVEKGANGTDSRFSSALKKEKVYVISLSNEGGRNAFKTSGAERTLESVSSSDAEVQVRAPCTVTGDGSATRAHPCAR
jgi:hypothetical protein